MDLFDVHVWCVCVKSVGSVWMCGTWYVLCGVVLGYVCMACVLCMCCVLCSVWAVCVCWHVVCVCDTCCVWGCVSVCFYKSFI